MFGGSSGMPEGTSIAPPPSPPPSGGGSPSGVVVVGVVDSLGSVVVVVLVVVVGLDLVSLDVSLEDVSVDGSVVVVSLDDAWVDVPGVVDGDGSVVGVVTLDFVEVFVGVVGELDCELPPQCRAFPLLPSLPQSPLLGIPP